MANLPPAFPFWCYHHAMPRHPETLRQIFAAFFSIGLQSFGGGSATFFLIHQACQKRNWLPEDLFLKYWALAQMTPGIGLAKITLLIGKRLRGWPGLAAAISGLMLPSALITALMTAGYAVTQDLPVVKAAMRGILPATIGLTLALSWDLGRPLLIAARLNGKASLALALGVVAAAALLFALAQVSPVVILLLAGALFWLSRSVVKPQKTEKPAAEA